MDDAGNSDDLMNGDDGIDKIFGDDGNATINGTYNLALGADSDTCSGGTGANNTLSNCETVV